MISQVVCGAASRGCQRQARALQLLRLGEPHVGWEESMADGSDGERCHDENYQRIRGEYGRRVGKCGDGDDAEEVHVIMFPNRLVA